MNVEGARIAREVADEHDGFVAGSVGPLNVTLSLSPAGRRPGLPRRTRFDQVVETYAEQIRGAARRRRRPAADRDDLRHAEREGGDRRRARGRAGAAALDLVHDRRPLAAARSPGRRSRRSGLDRARRAADRRRQLLARRARDAAVRRRRSRAIATDLRLVPSERRACRTRSAATTSSPTTPARSCASSPRTGCVNIVGGCCGSTPGAHRGDRRRPCAGSRRGRSRAGRRRPRFSGLEPFEIGAGHRLRDDRRAHERHRLGALPPPDRGGRLPARRSTSRSSRCAAARTCST